MSGLLNVQVNCPDERTATSLADRLVTQRLAAACNVSGPMRSTYLWQGELCRREEFALTARTTAERFDAIVVAVRETHPYDTPSVFATAIDEASPRYTAWVRTCVEARHDDA